MNNLSDIISHTGDLLDRLLDIGYHESEDYDDADELLRALRELRDRHGDLMIRE